MTRIGSILAVLAALAAWQAPGQAASPPLTFHFLDIGQGDATLVSLPTGEHVLVDGGENGDEKRLVSLLEARGVKTLDMVVMTHPHADHIGGLDLIWSTFPVRLALDSGGRSASRTYANTLKAIAKHQVPLKLGRMGLAKQYGPVRLEVLAPMDPLLKRTRSDENNNSIVTRWQYGDFTVLMTGDAESEGLDRLMKQHKDLKATVLKVPHHGSRYTMSQAFLDRVRPAVAVVSVGAKNEYGHPHKEAMDRLKKAGAKTYLTSKSGTVTISSTGKGYQLKTER